MKAKLLKMVKSRWSHVASAFILGVLLILTIRFFSYHPEKVHYHANFDVYINGKQEKFLGPRYYEETEAVMCNSAEQTDNPSERAHMHGNVFDVVHVEDHLVTWGNFFQNLGWNAGDSYISVFDKVYQADNKHKLTYVLNGKEVDGISNTIVNDLDRLLVNYGSETNKEIQTRFNAVPATAHKYDIEKDPASCGSNTSTTTKERLRHLF
jgi:hypothetical protein